MSSLCDINTLGGETNQPCLYGHFVIYKGWLKANQMHHLKQTHCFLLSIMQTTSKRIPRLSSQYIINNTKDYKSIDTSSKVNMHFIALMYMVSI